MYVHLYERDEEPKRFSAGAHFSDEEDPERPGFRKMLGYRVWDRKIPGYCTADLGSYEAAEKEAERLNTEYEITQTQGHCLRCNQPKESAEKTLCDFCEKDTPNE